MNWQIGDLIQYDDELDGKIYGIVIANSLYKSEPRFVVRWFDGTSDTNEREIHDDPILINLSRRQ